MQEELGAPRQAGQARPRAVLLELLRLRSEWHGGVESEVSLISSAEVRRRTADVAMRIGASVRDNSHQQNRGPEIPKLPKS